MNTTGKHPVDETTKLKDSSGKVDKGAIGRRIVWSLSMINAIVLIGLIVYLYYDRGAPEGSSLILSKLRWWSQPWGEYVPLVASKTVSAESQGALLLGSVLGCFTLVLAVVSAFLNRGRERLFLPVFGLVLAVGWTLVGANWDFIRIRGQSADLVQYVGPVSEFAKLLENSWPDQGGEIKDFGAFLAYPYGKPHTLLMLGDSRIPNTPLQVAAVERTPGKAIRFQLTGDAPNIWFEWRVLGTVPTLFQGGLQQIHTPITFYKIAENTFVVKYSITGPDLSP